MSFLKKKQDDMADMRFAQGLGATVRFANEIRAAKQIGRLAPLTSSNLQEDVLRGNIGPTGLMSISGYQPFDDDTKPVSSLQLHK